MKFLGVIVASFVAALSLVWMDHIYSKGPPQPSQGHRANVKINEIAEMADREAKQLIIKSPLRHTVQTLAPTRFGSTPQVVTVYSLTLGWSINDATAVRERLYRKAQGGAYTFRDIGLVQQFTDSPLDPQTTYSYYVTSLNNAAMESQPSNILTVIPMTPTPSPTATATASATATPTATVPPASPSATATATATPTATIAPSPTPGLSVSILPTSQTVTLNQTFVQKTSTTTVTRFGYSGPVAMDVDGLPPGIEPAWLTTPVIMQRKLTFLVCGFVQPGTYTYTIVATGALGLTATTTGTLIVR